MISNWTEKPEIRMAKSEAFGRELLRHGTFGADLIEFPPGGCVPRHTHEGNHILFCVAGDGRVTTDESEDLVKFGECYLIRSNQPHEIHAGEHGMRLLVVGDNCRDIGSEDRLSVVEK